MYENENFFKNSHLENQLETKRIHSFNLPKKELKLKLSNHKTFLWYFTD